MRAAVLEAAARALAARGYENFSIAEIAATAGVHETSIYRRWGDRTALALDACLHFAEEALPVPDTGSLRGDLTVLVANVAEILRNPTARALLAVSLSLSPAVDAARRAYWRARFSVADAIFERAAARGEISPQADGRLLLEALIAPLYLRALVTGDSFDNWPAADMVDRMLRAFPAH